MAIGMKAAPLLLLQLIVRRIEWVTLGALIACLAGAALQWLVLPRIDQNARVAQALLIDDPVARNRVDDDSVQAERYRDFQERLAGHGNRSAWLKVVFSQAAAAGISLPQGDYSVAPETDGGYDRLQIILPVKGTYQQIRSFAKALLDNVPALSLDEITFRRDSIRSPTVEARLRLTLYVNDR